ncbi:glycosyltransferase family 4 protein [Hymenobacter sp. BT491]|uniref:glycosyltransferase family 4 protein n=1 Tax=Hymenobacter sp. BT491 TaxID=2766779 RepID=UPI0016536EA9|nr:glycosyltransferase family 4 protein [Hymenobacter sp. BT491]MBC6988301.1 glycosyltransferase family 4 protein [Hymenobacter sp. BT491]
MRLAYIISGVDRMESLERTLEELQKIGYYLYVIQLNPSSDKMSEFLNEFGIDTDVIACGSPTRWVGSIWKMRRMLLERGIQIVHAHFLLGGLLGISAAALAHIKTRIYTRHHGSEHHLYHPRGVVLDKYINAIATDIIAISPVVTTILSDREGVPQHKLHSIPHGLDFSRYDGISQLRVNKLKEKYGLDKDVFPVVGVIARYDASKGHEYIIKAFKRLLPDYPSAKLVLANARGSYKNRIQVFLAELPVGSYVEVEYEYDVAAMYKLFDVFVHIPTSSDYESFGLVYLEALALAIPSVFTLSGIGNEFLQHEANALLVPYRDSEAVTESIRRLITDQGLTERLKKQGRAEVLERFAFSQYFSRLLQLYKSKISR